jgi:hypothetical protein
MRYSVTLVLEVDPDANFLAVDDSMQSISEVVELALHEIDDMVVESILVEKESR